MRTSLFAYGFRAQFLLAGCAALLLVPVWASNLVLGTPLGSTWPPTLWHGHEMLYGFIASAIAGFLLTAVPSWTGEKGFAGWPLMMLAGIWLAARLLIASSAGLSPLLAAAALSVFAALILGGLDSVLGAIVASLIVGWVEAVAAGYLGGKSRDVVPYVVVLAILVVRPYGLFGTRTIERL